MYKQLDAAIHRTVVRVLSHAGHRLVDGFAPGDDVTVQGQQLQHQTEMLTRRLPFARTALETIAKRDVRPRY